MEGALDALQSVDARVGAQLVPRRQRDALVGDAVRRSGEAGRRLAVDGVRDEDGAQLRLRRAQLAHHLLPHVLILDERGWAVAEER